MTVRKLWHIVYLSYRMRELNGFLVIFLFSTTFVSSHIPNSPSSLFKLKNCEYDAGSRNDLL